MFFDNFFFFLLLFFSSPNFKRGGALAPPMDEPPLPITLTFCQRADRDGPLITVNITASGFSHLTFDPQRAQDMKLMAPHAISSLCLKWPHAQSDGTSQVLLSITQGLFHIVVMLRHNIPLFVGTFQKSLRASMKMNIKHNTKN